MKYFEIWWRDSLYISKDGCKKPDQNSIFRYDFPFFGDLRILAALKNSKKKFPWNLGLKLWQQEENIILSMPAKNRVKIRSLAPKRGLMSAHKKGYLLVQNWQRQNNLL
jgi:hypothetical protein